MNRRRVPGHGGFSGPQGAATTEGLPGLPGRGEPPSAGRRWQGPGRSVPSAGGTRPLRGAEEGAEGQGTPVVYPPCEEATWTVLRAQGLGPRQQEAGAPQLSGDPPILCRPSGLAGPEASPLVSQPPLSISSISLKITKFD